MPFLSSLALVLGVTGADGFSAESATDRDSALADLTAAQASALSTFEQEASNAKQQFLREQVATRRDAAERSAAKRAALNAEIAAEARAKLAPLFADFFTEPSRAITLKIAQAVTALHEKAQHTLGSEGLWSRCLYAAAAESPIEAHPALAADLANDPHGYHVGLGGRALAAALPGPSGHDVPRLHQALLELEANLSREVSASHGVPSAEQLAEFEIVRAHAFRADYLAARDAHRAAVRLGALQSAPQSQLAIDRSNRGLVIGRTARPAPAVQPAQPDPH